MDGAASQSFTEEEIPFQNYDDYLAICIREWNYGTTVKPTAAAQGQKSETVGDESVIRKIGCHFAQRFWEGCYSNGQT